MNRIPRATALLAALALASAFTPALTAQVPQYRAELLGTGFVVNDMNESGQVVGWTVNTVVRAFLAGPDGYTLLPHPEGYNSAWAQGINDAGVIVGSASTGGFPEFGQAVAWYPDGEGGYDAVLLGQLPTSTQSVAYDVNNRGDIVGVSLTPGFQGGPSTWFNSPDGILNISALGAPSSPKQVNDEGVVTGISGGLFDLDTLSVMPLPTLAPGQSNYQGWAVNELGEIAGTGFYGSQRAAAGWSIVDDWKTVSLMFSQSASVQAFDINDAGVILAETPAPSAYFPGLGVFPLESLLVPAQAGQFDFFLSLGGAVNDAGQIAALATYQPTGASGVVLLTPVTQPYLDLGASLAGVDGAPQLTGKGSLFAGTSGALVLRHAAPDSLALLVLSATRLDAAFKGGVLVPAPDKLIPMPTDAAGLGVRSFVWPAGLPAGAHAYLQAWIPDAAAPAGLAASNALELTAM